MIALPFRRAHLLFIIGGTRQITWLYYYNLLNWNVIGYGFGTISIEAMCYNSILHLYF